MSRLMIKSNICVATAWHNNWRLIWLVLMAANWDNGRIRLPCLRGRYFVCTSLDDLTFLFLFHSTYSITIHITLLKARPPTYSVIHYYLNSCFIIDMPDSQIWPIMKVHSEQTLEVFHEWPYVTSKLRRKFDNQN